MLDFALPGDPHHNLEDLVPTYVYKNLKTGETFELTQRISEPALTVHPESGEPVKRLVQPVGIAFKGSGFYVTDSRGSSNAKKGGASEGKAEGGGKSEDGGSSKSESKAEGAAKPEAKPSKSESKSKD